jgi:fumarate reductase flavoprotein subunit
LERRESRGAHQRLDEGLQARDDVGYLKHSQVFYQGDAPAELRWQAVDTRFSAPAARVYGDAAKGGKA